MHTEHAIRNRMRPLLSSADANRCFAQLANRRPSSQLVFTNLATVVARG